MCKANLKPEIKQMVISIKTKSMSKLLEAAIDAKDCHKELDQKNKSKRIEASAPSTNKIKKREIFNIQIQRLPESCKIPKMKLPGRKNIKEKKCQVLL